MKKVVIRSLKLSEIDKFYALFKNLVDEGFPEYSKKVRIYLSSNPRGVNLINLPYMINYTSIILIAEINEQFVGFLIADIPYAGVSFCTWIAVSRNYQKMGIGKKIINTWIKVAKKNGAHSVRLETVPRNQVFYEKLGFELIGVDKNGYCGVDKYLYKKILGKPTDKNMTKY